MGALSSLVWWKISLHMAGGWVWMVFKILSSPGHSGISQVRAEKLRSEFTYGTKLINLSLGVALGKHFLMASSASLFSPFCILFTFPELYISLEFCWNNQRLGASQDRIFLIVTSSLNIFSLIYLLQPSLIPTHFPNHDWHVYISCGLSWFWSLTGWCFQSGMESCR